MRDQSKGAYQLLFFRSHKICNKKQLRGEGVGIALQLQRCRVLSVRETWQQSGKDPEPTGAKIWLNPTHHTQAEVGPDSKPPRHPQVIHSLLVAVFYLLTASQRFQRAPAAGNQEFRHRSLWETSHLQTTTRDFNTKCQNLPFSSPFSSHYPVLLIAA